MQAELRTERAPESHVHTVVWIDAGLKAKEGMTLVCKGDPRLWEVVRAYPNTVIDSAGINTTWKVGGLQ